MPNFVPDSGPLTAQVLVIGGDVYRFISMLRPKKSGCWLWAGGHNRKGYAKFWYDGKTGLAMHFAARLFQIKNWNKPGREPDHLCRDRGCNNPDHLQMVTRRTNLLRGNSPVGINFRKVHCINGHIFNEKNTYEVKRNGQTHRHCRVCIKNRKRLEYQKNPEKYRARARKYRE